MISSLDNRLGVLKLRLDLLDEVARVLLEGEDYNNGDFLTWFKKNKDDLARMYREELRRR